MNELKEDKHAFYVLLFVMFIGSVLIGCTTVSEKCKSQNVEDLNTVMHRIYDYEQMMSVGGLKQKEFIRNIREELTRWQDHQMKYDSCSHGKDYTW